MTQAAGMTQTMWTPRSTPELRRQGGPEGGPPAPMEDDRPMMVLGRKILLRVHGVRANAERARSIERAALVLRDAAVSAPLSMIAASNATQLAGMEAEVAGLLEQAQKDAKEAAKQLGDLDTMKTTALRDRAAATAAAVEAEKRRLEEERLKALVEAELKEVADLEAERATRCRRFRCAEAYAMVEAKKDAYTTKQAKVRSASSPKTGVPARSQGLPDRKHQRRAVQVGMGPGRDRQGHSGGKGADARLRAGAFRGRSCTCRSSQRSPNTTCPRQAPRPASWENSVSLWRYTIWLPIARRKPSVTGTARSTRLDISRKRPSCCIPSAAGDEGFDF